MIQLNWETIWQFIDIQLYRNVFTSVCPSINNTILSHHTLNEYFMHSFLLLFYLIWSFWFDWISFSFTQVADYRIALNSFVYEVFHRWNLKRKKYRISHLADDKLAIGHLFFNSISIRFISFHVLQFSIILFLSPPLFLSFYLFMYKFIFKRFWNAAP